MLCDPSLQEIIGYGERCILNAHFDDTLPWFMKINMLAVDIQTLYEKAVFAGLVGT